MALDLIRNLPAIRERRERARACCLNYQPARDRLYERLGKDGVRTIEGVEEKLEAVESILLRRGASAEARIAAVWYALFRTNPEVVADAGLADRECERSLSAAASEYSPDELPNILRVGRGQALKEMWESYAELMRAVARRAPLVLDPERAIRLWVAYDAKVRSERLAELSKRLRGGTAVDRDVCFVLREGIRSANDADAWLRRS